MLQHAYYSVISPEGCAGILWKSHEHAPKAAAALRFTSQDFARLEVVDDVLEEPLGGAHRDHHQMASRLKTYLSRTLGELERKSPEELVMNRYEKFRRIGVFLEEPADSCRIENSANLGSGQAAFSRFEICCRIRSV